MIRGGRENRSVSSVAVVALSIAMVLLPSCLDTHTWVEKEKPWTESTVAHTDRVQVERADGSHLTLAHPRIGTDERGEFLAGHVPELGEKEVRLDLSGVRTLEVWEKQTGQLAASIAAGIVVAGAIVLYLLHGSSTR